MKQKPLFCQLAYYLFQFLLITVLQLSMCTIQYTIRKLCIFLQEVSLAGEKSSVIGAASIFCARSVLKVSPVWPQHLESLFDLSLSDFSHCSNLLLATYAESEEANDQPESPQSLLEVILKRNDIAFEIIFNIIISIFRLWTKSTMKLRKEKNQDMRNVLPTRVI